MRYSGGNKKHKAVLMSERLSKLSFISFVSFSSTIQQWFLYSKLFSQLFSIQDKQKKPPEYSGGFYAFVF